MVSSRPSIEASRRAANPLAPWRYIALAPHFPGNSWHLSRDAEPRSREVPVFARLSGYELGDDKLPSDFRKGQKPTNFLQPFMEEHRQGFFHASDAYSIEALGQRHTWVKLAGPRVEALRQAFIANDSRMRIGFERDGDGEMRPISDAPDVMLNTRPWLKTVDIRGTAFVLRHEGEHRFSYPPQSRRDLHYRGEHDRKEHPSGRPSNPRRSSPAERRVNP